MGAGIIIIFFFGLILLILSPVAYFALKKHGYKKTGIVIASLLVLIVVLPTFLMIFESELYWESDAIKDLNEIGIILTDDFEILENEIVGSIDYYQTTQLLISSKDRNGIIEKIETSDNFKLINSNKTLSNEMDRQESEKVIWNYGLSNSFVRESYEKKEGYTSIQTVVTLHRKSDTLELRKIMD